MRNVPHDAGSPAVASLPLNATEAKLWYYADECGPGWGVQAERIAQARPIAQLNANGTYGSSDVAGISRSIQ